MGGETVKNQIINAEVDVEWSMIKVFCSATEDGNPSYWDKEFATKQWGGIIAPPGMLQTWGLPLQWKPGGASDVSMLGVWVELPTETDTMINVSTESEYYHPILVGEHLTCTDELLKISSAKETHLGLGYFVTTVSTFRNRQGEVIGKVTNTLYRYKAKEGL